jgi:hypothetical protein
LHNNNSIGEIANLFTGETPKAHRTGNSIFSPFFHCFNPSATEIRCQEKSKGGLRYEVILAEPNVAQVQIPKAVQQNPTPKPLSAEEIAEKLKAAEDRRMVRKLMKFCWLEGREDSFVSWIIKEKDTQVLPWLDNVQKSGIVGTCPLI